MSSLSEAHGPTTAYPLSHGQRALWFLQQFNPASTAYNVARAVRIRMPLDVVAFHRAWQALTDRHPALRTTFADSGNGPLQTVHAHWPVDFTLTDASAWTPEQLDAQLAAETYHPFDLARAPQLRLRLYQRAPDDYILLFVLHHIICDLWSLILLLLEVPQLYQAELTGTPARLRPVRAQYTDFIRTQNEMLAGPEGERLWAYWRERLHEAAPVLDLPTDRPRPATPTDRAASVAHTFESALIAPLRSLAEAHGANLHTLTLTAFQTLLHRYSGQSDIVVAAPRAGRTAGVSNVIGYFVNPVPVRADCAGNPAFSELLTRAARTVEADFAHGAYPIALLVERLQPERDLNQSPVFQVMFAWQKTTRLADWNAIAAINQLGSMPRPADRARTRSRNSGLTFAPQASGPSPAATGAATSIGAGGGNSASGTSSHRSRLLPPG